jgi:hypothetical protein
VQPTASRLHDLFMQQSLIQLFFLIQYMQTNTKYFIVLGVVILLFITGLVFFIQSHDDTSPHEDAINQDDDQTNEEVDPLGLDESFILPLLGVREDAETTLFARTNDGSFIPVHTLRNSPYPQVLNDRGALYFYGDDSVDPPIPATILTPSGNNISAQYQFILRNRYTLANITKNPHTNGFVYTNAADASMRLEDGVIFMLGLQGNVTATIDSDILPNGINASHIAGWSADENTLYVTRMGWEGFQHAGLWKVNVETEEVETISGIEGMVPLGALSILPEKDIAVGIQSATKTCNECMTGTTSAAPSTLVMYDLKENQFTSLYASNDVELFNPILTPDGTKIFFTARYTHEEMTEYGYTNDIIDKYETYVIDIDGTNRKRIGENIQIIGMSYTGEEIAVMGLNSPYYFEYELNMSENDTIEIININTTARTNLDMRPFAEYNTIRPVQCTYPQNYACFYDTGN